MSDLINSNIRVSNQGITRYGSALPVLNIPTNAIASRDNFAARNNVQVDTPITRSNDSPFTYVLPNKLTDNQKKYLSKGVFLKDESGQMYYVGLIKDNQRSLSNKTFYKMAHIKINNKTNDDGDVVHGSVDYSVSEKIKNALTKSYDEQFSGIREMAVYNPEVRNTNQVTARHFIKYKNGDLKEVQEYSWLGQKMHQKNIYLNKQLNSVIKYERDPYGRLNSICDYEFNVHIDGDIYHQRVKKVRVDDSIRGETHYVDTAENVYLKAGDKNPAIVTKFSEYGEPKVTTKFREDGSVSSRKFHKKNPETHYFDESGKLLHVNNYNGTRMITRCGRFSVDPIVANRGSSSSIGSSVPDSVLMLMHAIDSSSKYTAVIDMLERAGQVPHPALIQYGNRFR